MHIYIYTYESPVSLEFVFQVSRLGRPYRTFLHRHAAGRKRDAMLKRQWVYRYH